MAKAMRLIEENIKICDGALYVLDARAPISCINQNFDKIIGVKKTLYLLNKSDLVSEESSGYFLNYFKKEGKQCLAVQGNSQSCSKTIQSKLKQIFKDKIQKDKTNGVFLPLKIMVIGIPNTGKSAVINSICGERKAKTADKPGVTKTKQWVKLDDILLLDTPGTMPPYFGNQDLAANLALIGSINDDILDLNGLCLLLIGKLPLKIIEDKYKIQTQNLTSAQIFESICKKRGYILKGGEIDIERGSKAVIDDFRKGRLGKICLEQVL